MRIRLIGKVSTEVLPVLPVRLRRVFGLFVVAGERGGNVGTGLA